MRHMRSLEKWRKFTGNLPALPQCKPVVATLVAAVIGSTAASAALVVNPGFETPESTLGRPSTFGDWGDNVSQIVSAENGVTPYAGSGMLKFIATGPGGPDVGTAGTIYQHLDLSSIAASIASGQAQVTASAFFNRAFAGVETDTQFTNCAGQGWE